MRDPAPGDPGEGLRPARSIATEGTVRDTGEGRIYAASDWVSFERAALASSSRLAAPKSFRSAQKGPGIEFRSAQRCGVET